MAPRNIAARTPTAGDLSASHESGRDRERASRLMMLFVMVTLPW